MAPEEASHDTDCIVNHTIFLFDQDGWNKIQHDFLVMWCQCFYHMTLMASSIAPLHLLVQNDHNVMQHDFFSHLALLALTFSTLLLRSRQLKQCTIKLVGHVMSLIQMSVSHDADSVINATIPFAGSWWSKEGATWLFWSCDVIATNLM